MCENAIFQVQGHLISTRCSLGNKFIFAKNDPLNPKCLNYTIAFYPETIFPAPIEDNHSFSPAFSVEFNL